ncbi:hypothetical protein [Sideroxydans lithotrophicus]|uniref:Uncharacterized protein n=1 Tax=Sideroxydans lithotrophicus (strain ES-1) TaxID=580332 RepID=D5CT61_SIDLE|nr:hypothetical protein [Sideroxydans lithotrophicus]ADE12147.1 conserved hypothetical protein [Sideroxydans lithotrophicus ES-1]
MASQQSNAQVARVAAEKTAVTAPTYTNSVQLARLNQLEVKLGELKLLVAQINAAGGIVNSTVATDLTNLLAAL